METDLNFFEEVHLRENAANRKSARFSFNFKTGMLIGSSSVVLILGIVSFQNSGNSYNFEDVALHLDSIQIQQNNRIIELLETRLQRDTTIVHVIAPPL
jgi:hypothetical protein